MHFTHSKKKAQVLKKMLADVRSDRSGLTWEAGRQDPIAVGLDQTEK